MEWKSTGNPGEIEFYRARRRETSFVNIFPHLKEGDFRNISALRKSDDKVAVRSREEPWTTIGNLLDAFNRAKCRNYLASAGHEFDQT